MRGRELFRLAKPALMLVVAVLWLLPRAVVGGGWWLVRSLPGPLGVGLRYCWCRRLAARCGDVVMIGPGVTLLNWDGLELGSNVSLHVGCYVDALGGVRIGNDVSIAHHTSLVAFDHTWERADLPIRDNPVKPGSIAVSDDVWIGAGVRVLAGSSIGRRSVVAAGAVVRGDLPGGAVYGGIPARALKGIGPA